jgi:hypothetical protein
VAAGGCGWAAARRRPARDRAPAATGAARLARFGGWAARVVAPFAGATGRFAPLEGAADCRATRAAVERSRTVLASAAGAAGLDGPERAGPHGGGAAAAGSPDGADVGCGPAWTTTTGTLDVSPASPTSRRATRSFRFPACAAASPLSATCEHAGGRRGASSLTEQAAELDCEQAATAAEAATPSARTRVTTSPLPAVVCGGESGRSRACERAGEP